MFFFFPKTPIQSLIDSSVKYFFSEDDSYGPRHTETHTYKDMSVVMETECHIPVVEPSTFIYI